MADYKKMYIVLCSAIDAALDSLENTSNPHQIAQLLQGALLEAEEIYIKTASGV